MAINIKHHVQYCFSKKWAFFVVWQNLTKLPSEKTSEGGFSSKNFYVFTFCKI